MREDVAARVFRYALNSGFDSVEMYRVESVVVQKTPIPHVVACKIAAKGLIEDRRLTESDLELLQKK